MSTVAFIGLGNMGTPMSSRLMAAGHTVRGFDLQPEARERLAAAGGTPATTAAEAVDGADIVVLMLPNSAIVASVVDELDAASAIPAGATVVDMSSSEPLATQQLAARLAEHGIPLVDAPVSGGVRGAENGKLTIMAGGDAEHVALVTPVLESLGRVVACGPIGAGHAIKALNNLLSATHLWATSEAIEAGRRFGLDPEVMLSVFNGSSGRSGSTENKWPNFILPGGFDSGFSAGLMLKDMRIATDLAAKLDARSLLGEEAVDHWAEAVDELGGTADHTRIAEWIAAHPVRGAREE